MHSISMHNVASNNLLAIIIISSFWKLQNAWSLPPAKEEGEEY